MARKKAISSCVFSIILSIIVTVWPIYEVFLKNLSAVWVVFSIYHWIDLPLNSHRHSTCQFSTNYQVLLGITEKENRCTKVFKSRNLRSINGLYYVQVNNSESVYRCIGYWDCPNPDLNRTHFGLSRPMFLYHLRAENESVFIL